MLRVGIDRGPSRRALRPAHIGGIFATPTTSPLVSCFFYYYFFIFLSRSASLSLTHSFCVIYVAWGFKNHSLETLRVVFTRALLVLLAAGSRINSGPHNSNMDEYTNLQISYSLVLSLISPFPSLFYHLAHLAKR